MTVATLQTYLSKIIITLVTALLLTVAVTSVVAPQAGAQNIKSNLCGGADLSLSQDEAKCSGKDLNGDGQVTESERDGTYAEDKLNKLITQIINVLSVIIGIVAVIMIIWGGFKFITSSGDSGNVSSAKNTVIYAIVGLIIVALAQVIVRFVLNKV